MGGIAAHGYVNGKAVSRPPGMSEANLPWPHLRSGAVEITPSRRVETTPWTSMPPFIQKGTINYHPRL